MDPIPHQLIQVAMHQFYIPDHSINLIMNYFNYNHLRFSSSRFTTARFKQVLPRGCFIFVKLCVIVSTWLSRQQKDAPMQTLNSVCQSTGGLLTTSQSPTYKTDGSSWLLINMCHVVQTSKIQVCCCEKGDTYIHVKTVYLNRTNPPND